MTDQRPIDPSTLRDGDYVRAEGDGWAAEGYYYRREIRSKAGWNVVSLCGEPDERVTILRPVLVKGDRVEVAGITGEVFAEPGGFLMVLWPDESTSAVPDVISRATRLPAAPEPAPIEVGDWWADEEGLPHVVEVLHDGSVGMRRWTYSVVNRFVEPSLLRDHWTRLDGPPEPPMGSVYVIDKTVWHADDWGHIAAAAGAVGLEWATVRGLYDVDRLATLRIFGSVD